MSLSIASRPAIAMVHGRPVPPARKHRDPIESMARAAGILQAAGYSGVHFEFRMSDGGRPTIFANWARDDAFASFYLHSVGGKCWLTGAFTSRWPVKTVVLECARCEFPESEGAPLFFPAAAFAAVVLALRGNPTTEGRI